MNLIQDLKWRGLIYDGIDLEGLEKRLVEGPITLYCGFDPTADSLHIGSLLPIVTLLRFHKEGHNVITLTGGGTGLVGDPTGKKNERTMNSKDTVKKWSECFKKQFSKFIEYDEKTAFFRDNYSWLGNALFLDMLRDYGRYFSVNYMLAKDCVKSRLENGLTYLEFTYMIMQSVDFLKMFQDKTLNCQLQIGGQDQWGNITSGVELIRKVEGSEAKVYALTMPLITKSDGGKFGKTETGTIWLDEEKTSPYEMYQFFINTADNDVIRYMKYYTFLSKEEIAEYETKVKEAPHLREAQKRLAKEIIILVHGERKYEEALKITNALFSGNIKDLSSKEIEMGFKDLKKTNFDNDINIVDLLVLVGAASSKREAREFISNGATLINGEQIKDIQFIVTKESAIDEKYIIIRRGKKNYYMAQYKKED